MIFLQIHFLLIVSYCVFVGVSLIRGKGGNNFIFFPLQQLRLAQIIILATFALPIGLSFIPIHHFPKIALTQFTPLPETDNSPIRKLQFNIQQAFIPNTLSIQNQDGLNLSGSKVNWYFLFEILFTLGLVVSISKISLGFFRLRNLVRKSNLIKGVGKLRMVTSDSISIPMSFILPSSAYVLIPEALLTSPKDFRAAILHELQHHRAKDTHWAFFYEFLICLFFFNPAFYLWRKKITELQELACDEAIMMKKKVTFVDYANCLLKVAETTFSKRNYYLGTTGMALACRNPKRMKSFLKRRIEMLFKDQNSTSLVQNGLSALITSGLVFTVMLSLSFSSQRHFRSDPVPEIKIGSITTDSEIEAIANEVLTKYLKTLDARAGYVLVSDPDTGRLLAIANQSRDPNWKPTQKYWALSMLIDPASLSKVFATAGAIQQKATTIDEVHNCEKGAYKVNGKIFKDWKEGGFDHLTTAGAIIYSSNICGIKIAEKLKPHELEQTLLDFGFGPEGSAKGFPMAASGIVPAPEQVQEGIYNALIGGGFSGLTASPLELVQAMGAIANGGTLLKPKQADDVSTNPTPVRRVLSSESSFEMKSALARVVTEGTGLNHATSQVYSSAGKTATAHAPDWKDSDNLGGENNLASFLGFAPLHKPQLVVLVGVYQWKHHHPTGSSNAGPIFKEVLEGVLQHLKVKPDQPNFQK